jgi:hypothetical protein
MATLWDKPKKKWHEYTDAQKRNAERYGDLKRRQALNYHATKAKAKRIERRNKQLAKENWREMMENGLVDTVKTINWVKDTPRSLALQFLEWKRDKQR